MELSSFERSHIGRVRKSNQDYCCSEELENGKIFIVCDGMGGHAGGEKASRAAASAILHEVRKSQSEDPASFMARALEFANEQVIQYANDEPALKGMGTTAVILLIRGEDCYIGHVGDSRIYLYTNKTLNRLTKDHSALQNQIDLKKITTHSAAEIYDQRNVILKAIGHNVPLEPTVSTRPFKVKSGDCFLLCTDGLCGMLTDPEMASFFEKGLSDEEIADSLVNEALNKGGKDNLSFYLVRITSSTYYGPADFQSFNPPPGFYSSNSDPDFDRTTQFTEITAEQSPETGKPKGQRKWSILVVLSISIFVLIAAFFLYLYLNGNFSNNKEDSTGHGGKSYSKADLLKLSYNNLDSLANKGVKVVNMDSVEDIRLESGEWVRLITKQSYLSRVMRKDIPKRPGIIIDSNSHKKGSSVNNAKANDGEYVNKKNNKKQAEDKHNTKNGHTDWNQFVKINHNIYQVQVREGGETTMDLLKRVKKSFCPSIKMIPESFLKLNNRNTALDHKIMKLLRRNDTALIPGGKKVWVECNSVNK